MNIVKNIKNLYKYTYIGLFVIWIQDIVSYFMRNYEYE